MSWRRLLRNIASIGEVKSQDGRRVDNDVHVEHSEWVEQSDALVRQFNYTGRADTGNTVTSEFQIVCRYELPAPPLPAIHHKFVFFYMDPATLRGAQVDLHVSVDGTIEVSPVFKLSVEKLEDGSNLFAFQKPDDVHVFHEFLEKGRDLEFHFSSETRALFKLPVANDRSFVTTFQRTIERLTVAKS